MSVEFFEHRGFQRKLLAKASNTASSYQSFLRISSGFKHIRDTKKIQSYIFDNTSDKKYQKKSESMFWFLRRTGAANFLSSFNNNSTNGASKVTSYKNEKNNSGCHVSDQNRITAFLFSCCDVCRRVNLRFNSSGKNTRLKNCVMLKARNTHLQSYRIV